MTNLTPIHEVNAREVSMMVGKAVCAYANWLTVERNTGNVKVEKVYSALLSEYEATIRILDFFVKENLYEIQNAVTAEAESMVGIH